MKKHATAIGLDHPIIPASSAGGIELGTNLWDLLEAVDAKNLTYDVSTFEVWSVEKTLISLFDGCLEVVVDADETVKLIECGLGYRGLFNEKYFSGMSPHEIRSVARSVDVRHQLIFVDDIDGFAFVIPDQHEGNFYDDIDDIRELPMVWPNVLVTQVFDDPVLRRPR